jgi:uncharacterized membrane protein YqjE
MSPDPEASRSEGGLFGSLRRFGQSLLGALQTRLEILSTDIAVARASLIQLVLLALGVLFCFQVGVFLAVLFLVLLAGSEHRMMVIGITSGLLLLLALAGALWILWWLKHPPPFFAGTLAELRKDQDRLGVKK